MQASHLIVLLMFLFISTASSFPSKPLNERSTELTWQAWLLIDETQNKQDNTLRRRITPKSVFIAPTFSPESLPACSEGYQSDSMGRCIKIIMLNKELHLDFLLQQLNQKFGGMEDYEDDETTTSGPLNINIPLIGDADEGTDVAIVVAPANGLVMPMETEMQVKMNKTLSEEKVNVADIAGILGLKQAADVETTTIYSDSTTQASTVETTTINDGTTELNALFFLDPKRQVEVKTEMSGDVTTLLSTTSDAGKTETEIVPSTTEFKRETSERRTEFLLLQMDQALPFSETTASFSDVKREALKPNKSPSDFSPLQFRFPENIHQTTLKPLVLTPIENELSIQDSSSSTPISTKSTESYFSIGFKKANHDILYNDNNMKFFSTFTEVSDQKTTPSLEISSESYEGTTEFYTTTEQIPTSTSFAPATEFETVQSGILRTTEGPSNINGDIPSETSHFVKFPEDRGVQSDHGFSSPKPFEALLNQYNIHATIADGQDYQRQIFKGTTSANVDVSHALYERYKAHRENHRNRDKHSEWFHLPPKWSDTSQKPVVLRFSRKHGFIDTQQLGSNNFYREINPRLFGFPSKSRIHR